MIENKKNEAVVVDDDLDFEVELETTATSFSFGESRVL